MIPFGNSSSDNEETTLEGDSEGRSGTRGDALPGLALCRVSPGGGPAEGCVIFLSTPLPTSVRRKWTQGFGPAD